MPKDVEQTKILYLLAAIFVALLIQWILTQVKKWEKTYFVRKTIVKRILL